MMINQQLNKQMTDFNKTAMDNASKALTTLQEQTATMTNMFIDMCPWMPEEGKKAFREWDKPYRKSLEEITSAMNQPQDADFVFFYPVDKAIIVNEQLADIIVLQFRNDTPSFRKSV